MGARTARVFCVPQWEHGAGPRRPVGASRPRGAVGRGVRGAAGGATAACRQPVLALPTRRHDGYFWGARLREGVGGRGWRGARGWRGWGEGRRAGGRVARRGDGGACPFPPPHYPPIACVVCPPPLNGHVQSLSPVRVVVAGGGGGGVGRSRGSTVFPPSRPSLFSSSFSLFFFLFSFFLPTLPLSCLPRPPLPPPPTPLGGTGGSRRVSPPPPRALRASWSSSHPPRPLPLAPFPIPPPSPPTGSRAHDVAGHGRRRQSPYRHLAGRSAAPPVAALGPRAGRWPPGEGGTRSPPDLPLALPPQAPGYTRPAVRQGSRLLPPPPLGQVGSPPHSHPHCFFSSPPPAPIFFF